MADADDPPRAVVVLVNEGGEVPLGAIGHGARCDIALIDGLLRLRMAIARRGWSIRLAHVDQDMRELVELVGLGECLGLESRAGSAFDPRRQAERSEVLRVQEVVVARNLAADHFDHLNGPRLP